jgi:hypothetical protein
VVLKYLLLAFVDGLDVEALESHEGVCVGVSREKHLSEGAFAQCVDNFEVRQGDVAKGSQLAFTAYNDAARCLLLFLGLWNAAAA